METITKRFNEGWAMLRRSFNFAEHTEPIPKLSLVYVYSERSVFTKHIKSSFFDKEDLDEKFWRSVPDWMQVQMNNDIYVPPEAKEDVYEGEKVKTYVEGVLTKFFPGEYTPIDILKYTAAPNFHLHYSLQKNDELYLKRCDIKNKIHYLMSRGMDKKTSEFYVSSLAQHAVWFKPCVALLKEFEGWEPCRSGGFN